MSLKKTFALVGGLAVGAGSLAVAVAFAGDGRLAPELQEVRAAVAPYHSFEQAKNDGYSIRAGEPCVVFPGRPGSGGPAMGIHATNPELMADDAIDPARPEVLLYLPNEQGELKLVGIEYWKADADGNLATSNDRPSLFGQAFDGPMPGHGNVGMPVHYDLHVWVAEQNLAGVFSMFNPALSCP